MSALLSSNPLWCLFQEFGLSHSVHSDKQTTRKDNLSAHLYVLHMLRSRNPELHLALKHIVGPLVQRTQLLLASTSVHTSTFLHLGGQSCLSATCSDLCFLEHQAQFDRNVSHKKIVNAPFLRPWQHKYAAGIIHKHGMKMSNELLRKCLGVVFPRTRDSCVGDLIINILPETSDVLCAAVDKFYITCQ